LSQKFTLLTDLLHPQPQTAPQKQTTIRADLKGTQLAIEETSAGGMKSQIKLTIYADKGSDNEAKNGATKTVAS
jgi:hypothetical protein